MKVIKNFLYNAGYQLLVLIVPFVTAPYISRVLHAGGVGINAYTNSIVQYFVLLAGLGIETYGNREIAYVREDPQKLSRVFWEIQIVKIMMTVVSLVIFFLFVRVYDKYVYFLAIQAVNIVGVAFDISWAYMGLEDFKRTAVKNTVVRLLSVVLIFTLVRNIHDVGLYILIVAGSNLAGNLTLWPHMRNVLRPVRLRELRPLRHIIPTISLFIPTIAIQIYVQLNKTMLGVMIGATYSGYYYNSDQVIKMVLSVATALGTVMLPHVAAEFAKGNQEKINELLYKSFDAMSLLCTAMFFGVAAVSLRLGPWFYGKGFQPVGPAMVIESVVLLVIGWSNVIGTQFLVPTNRVRPYTMSIIAGSLFNVCANFFLIKAWGLNGAMVSTVLSEIVVTSYQLWSIRHIVQFRAMFKNVWKYLLAGVGMFIPVFYLNYTLTPGIVHFALEIMLGVVIYGVLILMLRPSLIREIKTVMNG
ncbi:MAG TPA: flippase [Candidatus Ligilactobacillus avistercoris]|nr:flippase [Candidatus Ligilactobacillus avistercoris]